MVHQLGLREPWWSHMFSGAKRFELRRDAEPRGFAVGDTVTFKREEEDGTRDDRIPTVSFRIEYVLRDVRIDGETYGLESGFVILGLDQFSREDGDEQVSWSF